MDVTDGNVVVGDGTLQVVNNYNTTTFENQLSDGQVGSGEIIKYEPGGSTTLTTGRLYFLCTDGTWDETDADNTSNGSKHLLGVALGTSATTHGVLLKGFVRIPSTEVLNLPGSGATDGLPLYISTTAGHFDFNPPSASGDFVRVVGYCLDDDSSDILHYFTPAPT